ncbi:hypothetical protein [Niveispirillum sp.]|uniref:hypothetical protein n=1 Tax=Niveispirillum sp. TaxID=1917217 RepID=UPI001B7AF37C|nr:hypothetical protein [Niveispirillum sp.]MBP7339427.1 hypothetical protein [Niveispirillum sp.]
MAGMPRGDPADGIATEHVIWAATVRLSPADVLVSFRMPLPLHGGTDWEFVRRSLACRWRRLPERDGYGE